MSPNKSVSDPVNDGQEQVGSVQESELGDLTLREVLAMILSSLSCAQRTHF